MDNEIDLCADALISAGLLNSHGTTGSATRFSNLGCRGGETGGSTFIPLQDIADVVQQQRLSSRCSNPFVLKTHSNITLQPNVLGDNHKVDACLSWAIRGEDLMSGRAMHVANVVVPMILENTDGTNVAIQNCSHILSAAHHIMHNDVRRTWVYGITIEGGCISLWYFSRSHCTKSQSFSFKKEPRRLVSVLISLLYATRQELGYDERITRLSSRTYIYELPQGQGEESVWFKTIGSLFEPRTLEIFGRATRVWSAIQIVSKTNPTPVEGAHTLALKDVWLDSNVETEADLQCQLFEDITRFAQSDWRSDPRLSRGELVQSEILQQLSTYLEGDKFKELFLCIKHFSAGAPLRAVLQAVSNPSNLSTTSPEGALTKPTFGSMSQRTSRRRPSSTRISSKPCAPHNVVAPSSGEEYRKYCAFISKRRYFFVQEDVCQPMHDLPTFGDVIDVLKQTIIALKLMYCAGWVHRDISTGNILAILKSGRWVAKLADLEYAKRFPTFKGSSDTKTGTMYFMPAEIRSDATYHRPTVDLEMARKTGRLDDVASTETHVIYNPQHDLESVWWIILWIITCCLAPDLRISHAKRYFSHSETATKRRRELLEIGDDLLFSAFSQQLSDFAFEMCLLGIEMHQLYLQRGSKGVVEQVEAYSDIHHKFWTLLIKLDATRDLWADMKVYDLSQGDPGSRDADDKPSDPVTMEPLSSLSAPSQREASPSPAPRRSAKLGGSNQLEAGVSAIVASDIVTSNPASQDPPPRPSKRQRR